MFGTRNGSGDKYNPDDLKKPAAASGGVAEKARALKAIGGEPGKKKDRKKLFSEALKKLEG